MDSLSPSACNSFLSWISSSETASNHAGISSSKVVLQRRREEGKTQRQVGRLTGRERELEAVDEKSSEANSGPVLPRP